MVSMNQAGGASPFPIGQVVATPGALEALKEAGDDAATYLNRHVACDWGDVEADDWKLNDEAVAAGDRMLSAYTLSDGAKIWIITEADRSVTTVLLPSDY